MINRRFFALAGIAVLLFTAGCSGPSDSFAITEIAKLEEPWAMTFLPDGRVLATERRGQLKVVAVDGSAKISDVRGTPEVAYGGQGGLGDVVLHPQFGINGLVYLSYAEPGGPGQSGAAVARARLVLNPEGGALEDFAVIWRQIPKVSGQGHYGHRIAFGPDGFLYISSGERQKFTPAQDMNSNLGKIVRLNDDGTAAKGNPFADQAAPPQSVTAQIWSLGHRNPLGLAFDKEGRLWNVEMGPAGGDELNLVERGANLGYPIVSNGDHYDGSVIPDHSTRPEFQAPAAFWKTVISPSSLMFYDGREFPEWQGDAFIGGLSSESVVRIEFNGTSAREAERFSMGKRIRAVKQGPDGAIWILEDGPDGRLLRLSVPQPK